ncbi:MAG: metallophosphoesterase family protein [Anaerolineae bacterium]
MARLAVLSDIHGNLLALEAALADLEAQGTPDAYWVLGDLAVFCPRPAETLARLRALPNVAFLQGNTDRYLVTSRRPAMPVRSADDWARMPAMLTGREASFCWTVERLSYADYEFLRDLPTWLEMEVPGYGRVVAVHATPSPLQGEGRGGGIDDETNLYPDTPDEQVLPHLAGLDARLLLYGHTHCPVDRTVDGVRLVNGGSVGLPLDGDPRLAYAFLDFEGGECSVAIRRVDYDRETVIAELERAAHPAVAWVSGILQRAAT